MRPAYAVRVGDAALAGFSAATRRITAVAEARETALAELGAPVAVWARGGDVLVAHGLAAQVRFTGSERLTGASARWRGLAADARIEDEVHLAGSGLVAFGTFAFADASASDSVLLVPRRIIGVRGGVAFRTDVVGDGPIEPGLHSDAGDAARFAPAAYAAAVSAAVERIRSGALQKVVLARDLPVHVPGFDLAAALRILHERYSDSWVFGIDGFFGASPETLVTVRDGSMTSRVLAGTVERGGDEATDARARRTLLESPKNRFEHALAVDSLLLTLAGRVDDLVLGRPFALRLPNVWHLATDATAYARNGMSALDLVAALHPTAAVAGAPRDSALDLIRELEPFDRGRYAGPVGWIDAAGDGEWAIGLRSAETETADRLRAYAGAGVVAGSSAEEELAETGWKFSPVLEAVGAAPVSTAPVGAAPAPRADSDPLPVR